MVMISERAAEAEDQAVPGHGEGELIIVKDCKFAIETWRNDYPIPPAAVSAERPSVLRVPRPIAMLPGELPPG